MLIIIKILGRILSKYFRLAFPAEKILKWMLKIYMYPILIINSRIWSWIFSIVIRVILDAVSSIFLFVLFPQIYLSLAASYPSSSEISAETPSGQPIYKASNQNESLRYTQICQPMNSERSVFQACNNYSRLASQIHQLMRETSDLFSKCPIKKRLSILQTSSSCTRK